MEESLPEETVLPTAALASDVDDTPVTTGDYSLTGEQRNELYEKGKQFLNSKKLVNALDCFLSCISGLTPKSGFDYLPQCLRKISEVYYGMEEYSKAVQFLQVEKMYYETALVDSAGMQQLIADKGSPMIDDTAPPAGAEDPMISKAHEYERLSQLCMKEDRPELALEFCGKATQLYQKTYGQSHPTTLKALDSFTLIYAEVGKRQYSDTVKRYKAAESQLGPDQVNASKRDVKVRGGGGGGESATGVSSSPGVASAELLPEPNNEATEIRPPTEEVSNPNFRVLGSETGPHPLVTGLCLIVGVWIVLLLAILGVLMVCESMDAPGFCNDIKSKLRYWYLVASYYYKQHRS